MTKKKAATKKAAAKPNRSRRTAMTARQKMFAEAYARCGVAAQAAREAGYSENRADNTGYELLTSPKYGHVREYIAKLREAAAEEAGVNIKQVIDEFALVAFSDISEFITWGPNGIVLKDSESLDTTRRRAVVEVAETAHGIRVKLADKVQALDRLGKHLGMFVDRVEHSGEIAGPPVVNLTLTTAKEDD